MRGRGPRNPVRAESNGTLGGDLAGDVGVVVYDHALGEAPEELDLRFGEAGAATCHNVGDAGAGNRDGIHVALNENGEILAANGILGVVHVVQNVAFE